MGKVFPEIDARLAAFIGKQQMFFVGTAPLAADGHVNLSPKGLESFAILDPRTVAYLDLIGSGIETVAHLRENGRIVIMFCCFEGPPRALRLHGRGEVIEPDDAAWQELRGIFPPHSNDRAIIRVHVERIADSCGFGVPIYRYEGQRTTLADWAKSRQGGDGLARYKAENNRESLDGLPGLRGVSGEAG